MKTAGKILAIILIMPLYAGIALGIGYSFDWLNRNSSGLLESALWLVYFAIVLVAILQTISYYAKKL